MTMSEVNLERAPVGLGGRFYGVYPALVRGNQDPDNLGRVLISLPIWITGGEKTELWARVAVLMAGKDRGTWFLPDVNDEVLVAFEGGDPRSPYVVGCLWNGADQPPESADSQNTIKSIVSRSGIRIELDDSQDGTLRLQTAAGRSIILSDDDGKIEISDDLGNTVIIESTEMTVSTSGKVKIQAGQIEIDAGLVDLNAAMVKASGVVQCETLIATSVVASSYTPGAGNIW
jgi:uncharacterized protein involved in type VI secretion and phage assembly